MELASGLVRAFVLAAVIFLAFVFGGLPVIAALVGLFLLNSILEAVRRVEGQLDEMNERLDRVIQRSP